MSNLGRMKASEVGDGFVARIEAEVGMGHTAWDMIDPKEIIAAVLNLALRDTLFPTPKTKEINNG